MVIQLLICTRLYGILLRYNNVCKIPFLKSVNTSSTLQKGRTALDLSSSEPTRRLLLDHMEMLRAKIEQDQREKEHAKVFVCSIIAEVVVVSGYILFIQFIIFHTD